MKQKHYFLYNKNR